MRAHLPFCLLFVSACGGASPPPPEPPVRERSFSEAAAASYGELATQLQADEQPAAGARMASKHDAALAGEPITLDHLPPVSRKNVTSSRIRKDVVKAYDQLNGQLTPGALAHQPEISAQAVTFYDCWVAEAQARPYADPAGCQEGFLSALATLESFPASDPAASAPVPLAALAAEDYGLEPTDPAPPPAKPAPTLTAAPPEDTPAPEAEPPIIVTYLVSFDWNSASLNRDAQQVLEMAVTDMHNIDTYAVVLNGHADLTGTPAANLALSMKRAESVAGWLEHSGVPQERITTYAFGDTDPKEQTAQGMRSARNRRVELVID